MEQTTPPRRHAGLLQLNDHQRQAVEEADRGKSEVRSPKWEVQSVRQSKIVIQHFLRAPVTLNWLTSRKSLLAIKHADARRLLCAFCPPRSCPSPSRVEESD
jgi:hypothetical protein